MAAATLDVISTELINEDNPLMTAPNYIITPHISWAAKEKPRQNYGYLCRQHPVF